MLNATTESKLRIWDSVLWFIHPFICFEEHAVFMFCRFCSLFSVYRVFFSSLVKDSIPRSNFYAYRVQVHPLFIIIGRVSWSLYTEKRFSLDTSMVTHLVVVSLLVCTVPWSYLIQKWFWTLNKVKLLPCSDIHSIEVHGHFCFWVANIWHTQMKKRIQWINSLK